MEDREIAYRKVRKKGRAGRIAAMVFCIFAETLLLLFAVAYGVLFVIAKGPSPTVSAQFVKTVKETSAAGFLANWFYSPEEIQAIRNPAAPQAVEDMDVSLIEIAPPTAPSQGEGPQADAWGLVDEDGDGIILESVKGEGFRGYMMVVLDPSRVVMATIPKSFGARGYTVEQMVKEFDGVAGINAGGFYDPNGTGNGSIPDTMVVSGGQVYYGEYGSAQGFAGFDEDHILHVGKFSSGDIAARNIQSGVGFGPVLIVNGVPQSKEALTSGVNPRTGIGQRSDGAVLLLVIEGRQVDSMGATYYDMAEVFLSYGAVNACNMDGGSSSVLWFEDHYVNHSASIIGTRPVPTAFVVLKKEG